MSWKALLLFLFLLLLSGSQKSAVVWHPGEQGGQGTGRGNRRGRGGGHGRGRGRDRRANADPGAGDHNQGIIRPQLVATPLCWDYRLCDEWDNLLTAIAPVLPMLAACVYAKC